jgi:WD40 repeat protein
LKEQNTCQLRLIDHFSRWILVPMSHSLPTILCLICVPFVFPESPEDETLLTKGNDIRIDQRSAAGSNADLLPGGAIARLGATRFHHDGTVTILTFSANGKMLASAGEDKTIRVWELPTGRKVVEFRGHREKISAVLFRDNHTIVSVGEDKSVRTWSVATGKELACFGMTSIIRGQHAALSLDRNTLVMLGSFLESNGVLKEWLTFWDTASGTELRRLRLSFSSTPTAASIATANLAFSPDGRTLAVGGSDDIIHLLDAVTGNELRRFIGHREIVAGHIHANTLEAVTFSPDGLMLASGGADQTLRLWHVATGKEIRCLEVDRGSVHSVAFSPDGKTIASGGVDQIVHLWEVATGKELRQLGGNFGAAHSVCFSPDGRLLAAGCADHGVHLWDAVTGNDFQPAIGHPSVISSIIYSPDAQILTTATPDLSIYQWDTATATARRHVSGHRPRIVCSTLAPSGNLLAAGDADGAVYLTREKGADCEVRQLLGHNDAVIAIAFSPDGNTLASRSYDGVIQVWGAANGTRIREIISLERVWTSCLCFTPDGKSLASPGQDGIVVLWDIGTGRQKQRMVADRPLHASCLAFSPDARNLAAGTYAGVIYLWETATGRTRCHFQGQEDVLYAIAFSPDGQTVACGGKDRAVHLWDLITGIERSQLTGHDGWISSLAFSPDGRTLASGSYDTTSMVWDLSHLRSCRSCRTIALPVSEVETSWTSIEGTDVSKAFRAFQRMVRAPEQTLPLLQKRIHSVRAPDANETGRLISQLDNDHFQVRQEAEHELAKMGELVEPALRKTLAANPSAEVRRRSERLLEKIQGSIPNLDELRAIRAVEILEHIGSTEARELLKNFTQGAPEARLTREAKQALERLHRLPLRK